MDAVALDRPAQEVYPGWVIAIALTLMAIGLVIVGSSAANLDRPVIGGELWNSAIGRQLVFSGMGIGAMLATAWVAPTFLSSSGWRQGLAWTFFLMVVLLLVAALVPGLTDSHRGSQRWLKLGVAGLSFQPSELAKPALVAGLAAFFSRIAETERSFWRSFVPSAGIVGIIVLLVGSENLGTAALLGTVGFGIMMVAGSRIWHLGLLSGIGATTLVGLLYAEQYRRDRLLAFTRMWDEELAGGYQPLQSLVTIASGSWWGTGLGAGIQKYGYLPESRTDFIFSALCEETGFLGACVVIGLFATLIWLGIKIAWNAPTQFERLLAFGLTLAMTLQAAMNIAVVTVITPTTGISLPLISAGGSGIMAYGFSIGLLAAIASRCGTAESEPA